MQKITRFMFALLVGIAAIGLTASPARATVIRNIDGSGQLTGAQNVDVSGTLYDVTFVDGTCQALFDGCDSLFDFDFTTLPTAEAAAQALLDQVFLDVAEGNFDSDPSLTFGCITTGRCDTFIPFGLTSLVPGVPGFTVVEIAIGLNSSGEASDGLSPSSTFSPLGDTSFQDFRNFATFSLVTAPVPEPGSLLLFGFGLGGLAFAGWRNNRRHGDR